MKIGLFCLSEHFEGSIGESIMEQLHLVELADKLGFDEAWFGEHHFNSFSVIPDPAAMIAYAAARTKKIRLGTAGFLASFYHPVRLAESIAVLDQLSGGRINAGFAKGGFAPDSRHFLRSKDDLRTVMFETVKAVDMLLHAKEVHYDGAFVRVHDSSVTPRPYQKQLPFYVATFSSEETIYYAATHGYGLMISQGATLQACVEVQNFYRLIAGHDPQMVVMRVFCVADTAAEAERIAVPGIDHFVKCMRAAQAEQQQPHFDAQNYKTLLDERNALFDGQKFFDNAIIGSPQSCIEKIDTLSRELSHLHLVLKPAATQFEANCAMLKRFDTQIRPNLTLDAHQTIPDHH